MGINRKIYFHESFGSFYFRLLLTINSACARSHVPRENKDLQFWTKEIRQEKTIKGPKLNATELALISHLQDVKNVPCDIPHPQSRRRLEKKIPF